MAYTSTNTRILEEHEGRALLLHECGDHSLQFIVCSNLRTEHYDGTLGYEEDRYSWDWGHYFRSLMDAADHWSREVLGRKPLEVECAFGTLTAERSGDPGIYDEIEVDLVRDGKLMQLAVIGTGPAGAKALPAVQVLETGGEPVWAQHGPEVRALETEGGGETDLHVYAYDGRDESPTVEIRATTEHGFWYEQEE